MNDAYFVNNLTLVLEVGVYVYILRTFRFVIGIRFGIGDIVGFC